LNQEDFEDLRTNLRQFVNEEREVAKLSRLQMDEFASKIATAHAKEMALEDFASHWGLDGLKP
jgi:uncharacterized protein YkwD